MRASVEVTQVMGDWERIHNKLGSTGFIPANPALSGQKGWTGHSGDII
jgi:hypothetical protein